MSRLAKITMGTGETFQTSLPPDALKERAIKKYVLAWVRWKTERAYNFEDFTFEIVEV